MKQALTSDNSPDHRGLQPQAPKPAVSGALPTDADARRALAWLEKGQPEGHIAFDDIAPKQTGEELAAFRKASYRRKGSGN